MYCQWQDFFMVYPRVSKSQVVIAMFSRHHDTWFIPNSSQVAYYQYVGSGRNAEDDLRHFGKHQGHINGLIAKNLETYNLTDRTRSGRSWNSSFAQGRVFGQSVVNHSYL